MEHSKKSGTGSAELVKPTWQFFDHLRYLNDYYQARETTSNIPKRDVDDKKSDTSKDEYQPSAEFIYNVNNPPSEKSRKKWKQSQEDELIKKSLEILNAPPPPQKESNPDVLFGELIGNSLSDIEDKRTKNLVQLQSSVSFTKFPSSTYITRLNTFSFSLQY